MVLVLALVSSEARMKWQSNKNVASRFIFISSHFKMSSTLKTSAKLAMEKSGGALNSERKICVGGLENGIRE